MEVAKLLEKTEYDAKDVPWELAFAINGLSVPRDHGYLLYSSLSRELPLIHEASWCAILPIRGVKSEAKEMLLHSASRLRFRLPQSKIGVLLPLVGRKLEVGGSLITLTRFEAHPVQPSATLDARLVVIRLTTTPRGDSGAIDKNAFAQQFTKEVTRQLRALEIYSAPTITGRRDLVVHKQRILGFSLRMSGLSVNESFSLLSKGVGGKRRMGCGVFEPTRLASHG